MIDIGTALSRINITHEGGKPIVFSISFVKEDGTIKKIQNARKNVKHQGQSSTAGNKALYNLKSRGILLIYDEEISDFRSIKISRIIEFNGEKVFH
jgi:N-acetyl-anhydromuramyl-L-alanine amidase AmpD